MKPELQQIAIEEACGWKRIPAGKDSFGVNYDALANRGHETVLQDKLPNYLNDLNAMHEAEKILNDDNSLHGLVFYCNTLMNICKTHRACVTATASQRAEAFLRTIGKWID